VLTCPDSAGPSGQVNTARSLRSNTFRYRPTCADIPVFQIWEQEAESPNLSIPTTGFVG